VSEPTAFLFVASAEFEVVVWAGIVVADARS
jgi:hypothetical protein